MHLCEHVGYLYADARREYCYRFARLAVLSSYSSHDIVIPMLSVILIIMSIVDHKYIVYEPVDWVSLLEMD